MSKICNGIEKDSLQKEVEILTNIIDVVQISTRKIKITSLSLNNLDFLNIVNSRVLESSFKEYNQNKVMKIIKKMYQLSSNKMIKGTKINDIPIWGV